MPKKKMTPARTIQKNVLVRLLMLPPLIQKTRLEKLFSYYEQVQNYNQGTYTMIDSDKLDHVIRGSVYKTPYFMI